MRTLTRTLLVALAVLTVSAAPLGAQRQQAVTPGQSTLTPAQQAQFMLTAKEVSVRGAGEGITNSRRATLTDGRLTHDVHIQTVDEWHARFETPRGVELNFRDTYRYNIAGYRLAALLGLDNVPVTVGRDFQGRPASVMWWIDDVIMDEGDRLKEGTTGPDPQRYASQVHIMRVFDELIQNTDRNTGNIQYTSDWMMWLIDHTRAFRLGKELRNPNRLERVEVRLFARIRGLTEASVKEAVGDSLNDLEIEAVAARARLLVQFFDKRIAELGEAGVLYVKR